MKNLLTILGISLLINIFLSLIIIPEPIKPEYITHTMFIAAIICLIISLIIDVKQEKDKKLNDHLKNAFDLTKMLIDFRREMQQAKFHYHAIKLENFNLQKDYTSDQRKPYLHGESIESMMSTIKQLIAENKALKFQVENLIDKNDEQLKKIQEYRQKYFDNQSKVNIALSHRIAHLITERDDYKKKYVSSQGNLSQVSKKYESLKNEHAEFIRSQVHDSIEKYNLNQ